MKFTITPSRIVINFIDLDSKEPNRKTVDYSTLFSLCKEDSNTLAGLTNASSEINMACNATEDIITPIANNSNSDLDSAIQKYDTMDINPSSQIAIEIKKIEDIQQYRDRNINN
jgi:ADP-ribosylglycohydrolase